MREPLQIKRYALEITRDTTGETEISKPIYGTLNSAKQAAAADNRAFKPKKKRTRIVEVDMMPEIELRAAKIACFKMTSQERHDAILALVAYSHRGY